MEEKEYVKCVLTYACADGPTPVPFMRVINLDTGKEEPQAYEVDCVEGWLVRYVMDANGDPALTADFDIEKERIEGRFRLEIEKGMYPEFEARV